MKATITPFSGLLAVGLPRRLAWKRRHFGREARDVEPHRAGEQFGDWVQVRPHCRGGGVRLIDAAEHVAVACLEGELELGTGPVEAAVAAGGRLHLEPEVAAVVGDRADVVVRCRVRFRCPNDAVLRIAETGYSLE